MKLKKKLAALLAFAMLFSLVTVTGVSADPGEAGTAENPLQIGSAADLLDFGRRVMDGEIGLCAELTTNITDENWSPVDVTGGITTTHSSIGLWGKSGNNLSGAVDSPTPYAGVFDGNGYTITLSKYVDIDSDDLVITEVHDIALFHTIGSTGVVKNLNLNVDFSGMQYIAGVAAHNYGTIERVKVTGNIYAMSNYAGGIAALSGCKVADTIITPGKILYCINNATVTGVTHTGGVAGSFLGEMRYSANTGNVTGNAMSGGLLGMGDNVNPTATTVPVERRFIVTDCYNAGNFISNLQNSTSSFSAALFGGQYAANMADWRDPQTGEYEDFQVSNVFTYGALEDSGNIIITPMTSAASALNYSPYDITQIFRNTYYLEGIGSKLFLPNNLIGNDGLGTDQVKGVIKSKTATEFATAEMAALLNNGREGAYAPWEFLESNAYPTLKFERAAYDPDSDFPPPPPPVTYDHITAAAGYGGTAALDGSTLTISANGNYKIDVIYIDGVPATAAQAVPSAGNAVHGAVGATIDLSSGFDDVKSIVATFAYTVNFNIPANGALSVSRGSEILTSGNIVRAGEILTVSYTGTDKLILNGLEPTDVTDLYKVVARRDAPPSVSFEPVNKDALSAAITAASALSQSDYTAASWAVLANALTAAQSVLANADAAQAEVNTATANLTAARNALVVRSSSSGSSGNGTTTPTPAPSTPAPAPSDAPRTAAAAGEKPAVSVPAATAVDAEKGEAVTVVEVPSQDSPIGGGESVKLVVTVDTGGESVNTITAEMPTEFVNRAAESKSEIEIESEVANVLLPEKAVAELAASGRAVSVKAERSAETGTYTFTVTSGGETALTVDGGIKATIPVSERAATAGTVAVLIHADGSREILKKSYIIEDDLLVPLSGSATIAITDNAKSFGDVAGNAWYADAVAFVTARELFTGTGETTFSPNASMTRAMLVTALHRLEGEPAAAGEGFADVSAGAYYANAVAWASANDIVSGMGDGSFAPDAEITREQLATILYRYAAALGIDVSAKGDTSAFADANAVSAYADEALRWAVGAGLITGRANPLGAELAPKGTATRAEVAAILQRFVEKVL